MDLAENITSPSQPETLEPATIAGFGFIKCYGDKMGTGLKYGHYKPARLYSKGDKWFVFYSYREPSGNFKRFKVYESLNSIKDPAEKSRYAAVLVKAVNYALDHGFNPFFLPELKVAAKTWSLVQGLNYFKQNLSKRGLRHRTIQTYESAIRMMYVSFQPILLDDIATITKQQVANCLKQTHEKKGWSNSTFNNNLTFVRAIFNYLIEAEILETNPASKIKPLPESVTRNRYFTETVFSKIKAAADPELLDFLLFLYHTGTRPNEARQLRYEHINRDSRLLMVPAAISKNKKDDYVPLSSYILEKYGTGEGLIFGTAVNHFTQKFNALKRKLKLPEGVNLYGIKHTRAIHLAQDGASPYAIMELFRHSSLEITMKYLKGLGLTVNREAADKVR